MRPAVYTFFVVSFLFAVADYPAYCQSGVDVNAPVTLQEYLQYAALNNAELKAAFEQWQAAKEQIPQAGVLPDPKFTYELEARRSPHGETFGVSQALPWFGTTQVRTAAAQASERAAEKRYQAQRLKLFAEVKQAYYDYIYLARQVEITGQNLELLKHFEEVARVRYATSQTTHPDHIRAQIETAGAEYEVQILRRLREPLVARLNAILNRPPSAELPWPRREEFKKIELNHQEIIALAVRHNPDLQAMDFEVDAARRQVDLAKKKFYPEIEVGVSAMQRSEAIMGPGENPLFATVSLTLPIWRDSYIAAQRQADTEVRKSLQQKTAIQNNITAGVESALYDFESSAGKIELYNSVLIPRAKELLTASEAAYINGSIDFLALIDARRMLLEYQLDCERAVAENGRKLAELEMLCGTQLPMAVEKSAAK